jgi:DNA invertase Pin-like site-specific DNA recombinase
MNFRILIMKTNEDIEEIEKCLHRSVKMTKISESPEGTIYECESLNPGGRPRSLSQEVLDDIKDMYFKGYPISKIAKKHGCTKRLVYDITTDLNEEKEQRLLEMVRHMKYYDMTTTKIAENLNISRPTALRIVKQLEENEKTQEDPNGKKDETDI